jgi:MOSC domain-containing protein YiiM
VEFQDKKELAIGWVAGIAVRTRRHGAMREVESATAHAGHGIEGDLSVSASRGITLIADERWRETLDQLHTELPWYTRRANVLTVGVPLADLIGRRVRVGEIELHLLGETHPCQLMDEQYPGLMQALKPNIRAGVHGRVLVGGTFRVGDGVTVLD